MKNFIVVFIALTLYPASFAQAEGQKLESLDPLKIIQQGMTDDASSVWGLRVFNMRTIGNHRTALEAGAWCAADENNVSACKLYAHLEAEAEQATASIIEMNENSLKILKAKPHNDRTNTDIKVLEAQLKILKNFPTPFNNVVREMVKKQ